MKKAVCFILLVCCLLLTACKPSDRSKTGSEPVLAAPTPGESPVMELSDRAQKWATDLAYLKGKYPSCHKDPFRYISEEEFNWKLDQLAAMVDDLTDDDIYFELTAIIAGMGDTHTRVIPPDGISRRAFPVLVWYFGDRLYLSGYLEGYDKFAPYLFREIVAVNGVDIAYLRQKAESLVYPGNSWAGKEHFKVFCFIPAFFDWAGCDYQEGYTFQILNENREVESVEIPIISWEEYMETGAVYPESFESVVGVHYGDFAGYLDGNNGGCVYLSLGPMDYPSKNKEYYQALFEKTSGLLEAHLDCGKLVVDLRSNAGGTMLIHDYIREGIQLLQEFPTQQVFVVTGGYTASAAIGCLTMFKEKLDAIQVGEPTGQFTSFFYYAGNAEGTVFHLPQSQITIHISTGWHEGTPTVENYYDKNGNLYEWENTILPDVFIYQDIEDVRQGKDSVIEWILDQ